MKISLNSQKYKEGSYKSYVDGDLLIKTLLKVVFMNVTFVANVS